MAEKKLIRKEIFEKRKALTQEQAEAWSREICQKVISLPQFQEASCVYAYVDYNKEVVTRDIIEAAWKQGKRVAVPKVIGPGKMQYYYLESFEQLAPGYFQIPEPAWGEEAQDEEAFLLVPGVAFDANRHRAGYGQGFYDRYLAAHRKHATAAVAFEFQIVEEVPAEPTDIFPDLVITEKRILS